MDEIAKYNVERVSEDEFMRPDPSAEPGTWNHFVHFVRPWITFLARKGLDASRA